MFFRSAVKEVVENKTNPTKNVHHMYRNVSSEYESLFYLTMLFDTRFMQLATIWTKIDHEKKQ